MLATGAHVALFGLWGLLVKRPTWLGLAYVLVWEQSLQNVPGWLANLTLRAHVRNLAELSVPTFGGLGSDPGPWWGSALVLVGIAGVSVVLAGGIVRRRELVLGK